MHAQNVTGIVAATVAGGESEMAKSLDQKRDLALRTSLAAKALRARRRGGSEVKRKHEGRTQAGKCTHPADCGVIHPLPLGAQSVPAPLRPAPTHPVTRCLRTSLAWDGVFGGGGDGAPTSS